MRNWSQYRIHSLHYSFYYILESASKHNMDLSFYIRHILLGLRSSFKGFFIGGANESAQKFWRQTWYWQNGFGRQQALLATVGDTFVWWLLMSFCHQQLCFQQPDIVPIICHQFLSPKTFPFELIYHIQFLYHNTNSVVLPKYYLSIEIIYKISYLKIKGVTIELQEIVYFGLDNESWY